MLPILTVGEHENGARAYGLSWRHWIMVDMITLRYNPEADNWVADIDFAASAGSTPADALRDLADEYEWRLTERDIKEMEESVVW